MKRIWSAVPLVLLAACSESANPVVTAESGLPGLQPSTYFIADTIPGNPICTQLGYNYGFKVDRGGNTSVNGTWQVGNVGSVTITGNGTVFSWTSTFGIDAVSAKGGRDGAIVYRYDPESFGDVGLNPPINPSGLPATISHIDFCFDLNLAVSKTAVPTYTRTYNWTIDKTATASSLLLDDGQVAPPVGYTVAVNNTTVDGDWAASGVITIHNPAPFATRVMAVTDVISKDIEVSVSCPELPAAIAAGGDITCTYTQALPDGAPRLNTATATADPAITATVNEEADGLKYYGGGAVGEGTGTAEIVFGAPTSLIDESVTVTDSRQGLLGTATGVPSTWNYSVTFGPYVTCGEYDVPNTASFLTNDRAFTGSDDWNVHIVVTGCEHTAGCTLTQGYWKTHSDRGPAPYDDGWKLLGILEEDTPLFASGLTWYQAFRTPPAGNPYFILAHQYMAARLNLLAGASPTPAVTAAMAQASTEFAAITGTVVPKAKKALFTSLGAVLDRYNSGLIGPGHCSE